MNGKLLVLCDELPGWYKGYTVKDSRYLKIPYINPAEDDDRIFICWDSIVPEDRAFIEVVKYYAHFTEMPEPRFILNQRGATDPATGNIKTSIQEESYYALYEEMLERIRRINALGGDVMGEAMEIAVQFPFMANSRFFRDFSNLLNAKNVVRILPTFSKTSDAKIIHYRDELLSAWARENEFMDRKSQAKVLTPILYTNFREVMNCSTEELLKIYSFPIFGELPTDGETRK